MNKTLLLEIGVEELPAIPFLKELKNIEKKYLNLLEKHSLASDFEFYYTPRRLVFWHREFKVAQDDKVEEFFGAPLSVAYKDGEPTPAALGFAKKCGVDLSEISATTKDGKEVLYYSKEVSGKSSLEVIPLVVREFLASLDFGKSMRWASFDEGFIRPIRWLNIAFGDDLVEMELFGIKSAKSTFVHRSFSLDPLSYNDTKEYFDLLKKGGVILYADERRDIIKMQIARLEASEGIEVEQDSDLLEEIVAITEYPTALLGSFDEEFLRLPPEVIITSMKENQRYFGVFKDAKLLNRFVVVSNALCEDYSLVVDGNERVLRPRLADANFFYDNDLRGGLSIDGLEKIVFMKSLGTLADKIERESNIAAALFEHYKPQGVDLGELREAMRLAKADLNSEMVYEFTELQGIVGSYYAKAEGKSDAIALAIREQYLPNKEGGDLPSTPLSALVALSIKLDTLLALFSIDEIPTGSRDPFALRRAVNGIIRICEAYGFSFDLASTLDLLKSNYKEFDTTKLRAFFIERLRSHFSVNASIVEAVLQSGDLEVLSIIKKVEALHSIVTSDGFGEYFSTFKRVANITKDVDLSGDLSVSVALFEHKSESELYEAFQSVRSKEFSSYEEELDALFLLSSQLDSFFEHVMVNAEDERVRGNRKALVASIYKRLLRVADIKEVSI